MTEATSGYSVFSAVQSSQKEWETELDRVMEQARAKAVSIASLQTSGEQGLGAQTLLIPTMVVAEAVRNAYRLGHEQGERLALAQNPSVISMANDEDRAYQEGHTDGHSKGYEEGYSEGFEEGFVAGLDVASWEGGDEE